MKKAFGDLYLFITAMLCLFCVSLITPGTSHKAHAAAKSVTLATGENFNNAIRSLTGCISLEEQPEVNYDKGPFTLNLINGSVANDDLVLLSTIVILSESEAITYQEAQSDTFDGAVLFDLNKDGTMDMLLTYSRSSTYYKYQFSAVKAHSIPGTLTLTLSDELKKLAKMPLSRLKA